MPWWKMSIDGEREGKKSEKECNPFLSNSASAERDASLALEPRSVKKVQAFGWLRQQALLRERKLKLNGTLVKQRLFR